MNAFGVGCGLQAGGGFDLQTGRELPGASGSGEESLVRVTPCRDVCDVQALPAATRALLPLFLPWTGHGSAPAVP